MAREPRVFEMNGFTAELIGPSRHIALFINAASRYFRSYVKRHTT